MAGFLKKMFPSLFGDPAEEALARKMRINSTLRRFDMEVKKQDGFIRQYLQQATVAKRTGDRPNYAQAKFMGELTDRYGIEPKFMMQAAIHRLLSGVLDESKGK